MTDRSYDVSLMLKGCTPSSEMSIFGTATFKHENFLVKHDKRGIVGMCDSNGRTCGSSVQTKILVCECLCACLSAIIVPYVWHSFQFQNLDAFPL